MAKRRRDVFDRESPTPSSPPAKRSASVHASQSSPIRPRAFSTFSTPFAYTVRTPLSVPQDSPTNPFGLKRSLAALELPRPTGFGKHICLRFQLVDSRPDRTLAAKRQDKEGGVYRVVQVPLNYTFRHLHKLILFLFATDINDFHAQLPSGRRTSLRSSATSHPARGKGKGRAHHDPLVSQWGGHYFEVLKKAAVHSRTTKPGVFKSGATVRTKLSSVRERRLFRDLVDPDDTAGSSSVFPKTLEDEDVDKEDWTWEAEDDFALSQVWYKGPSLDRGIIYVGFKSCISYIHSYLSISQHHQPYTSVHITANTLSVPARKGNGNTPYVFLAQATAGTYIHLAHVVPTEDGGEAVFPLSNSTALEQHLYLHQITKSHIDRWNRPDAFSKFLRREAERELALQRAAPSPSPSPTRTYPPLSDITSPSRRAPVARPRRSSSSPPNPSSDAPFPPSEPESDVSMYSACSDSAIFPFAFSAITPYPAHPLHRKRMQRAERRMDRLTKNGLVNMVSSDEEEKRKAKGKGKGKEKEKEKTEEDQEDDTEDESESESDVDEEAKENIRERAKPEIKTYTRRPSKAQQVHRIKTGDTTRTRARKPMPVMDIIAWTPVPVSDDDDDDDDDGRYVKDWGSVEV